MNILTFDIEEWFHLLDHPATSDESKWACFPSRFEKNMDRIFRLLEENQVGATFFCLGWTAEKYPAQIQKISKLGYEVACHSSRHKLAYEQTPEEFEQDFLDAQSAIESASGVRVNTYRMPGFSLTNDSLWTLDVLAKLGVDIDCSVFPASRGHGGLPNLPVSGPFRIKTKQGVLIRELPLNTVSFLGSRFVFSGGGYFRLCPLWALRRFYARSDYVMSYFHPRDFDSEQPRLPKLGPIRYFKSYYGLSGAEEKLRELLKTVRFTDVRTSVMNIAWDSTPIIQLH